MRLKHFLETLTAQGFDLPSVDLSGRMLRFSRQADSNKSAWFIGWQHYLSKDGSPYIVAVYGDWRTDEWYEYKSNAPTTREDRLIIEKKLKDAREQGERIRRERWDQVSQETTKFWDTLTSDRSSNAYLDKKQITELFGAKINGLDLVVPMRDVHGQIWGMQKITPEGGKYFTSGQRVEGCFHAIGDLAGHEIVIVEGFATGCSIHIATGKPVVCAFNAGNLAAVATAIRKRFTEAAIIIGGDDDQWTEGNPGRTKAEDAAKMALGKAVFPRFKSLTSRPTDFNDLYAAEGKDEVRRQILDVKPEKHYIIPLGHNHGDYYFVSNKNPQIQCISRSALNQSGLCSIQPLEYWEALSPSTNGKGPKWGKLSSDLMDQCHDRGVFTPDRIRGRGVWLDQGRVVVHLGNRLFYEGAEHPLHRNSLRSRFIYEQSEAMDSIHSKPLSVADCDAILDPIALLKFSRASDQILLAGWLAIAPICGALPWRSHVWLTGPSGTGKSYIMEQFIKKVVGDFSYYFRGQTTEAGIRQFTGCSARSIIFDEFETNDQGSGDRVNAVLELARQASSETDAIVAKGSAGGHAVSYKPRFACLVSSVRVNLKHEEDRNRFTVLTMLRHGEDNNDVFPRLEKMISRVTTELSHRLFARAVNMLPVLLQSIEAAQKVCREAVSARFAQQYAPLMAGYYMLQSDQALDEATAASLLLMIRQDLVAAATGEDPDEVNCLNHILEQRVKVTKAGNTSDKLILEMINDGSFDVELQQYGILRERDGIWIMNRFNALDQFFRNTKWSGGYAKALQRLSGTEQNQKWFPALNRKPHSTFIKFDLIKHKE